MVFKNRTHVLVAIVSTAIFVVSLSTTFGLSLTGQAGEQEAVPIEGDGGICGYMPFLPFCDENSSSSAFETTPWYPPQTADDHFSSEMAPAVMDEPTPLPIMSAVMPEMPTETQYAPATKKWTPPSLPAPAPSSQEAVTPQMSTPPATTQGTSNTAEPTQPSIWNFFGLFQPNSQPPASTSCTLENKTTPSRLNELGGSNLDSLNRTFFASAMTPDATKAYFAGAQYLEEVDLNNFKSNRLISLGLSAFEFATGVVADNNGFVYIAVAYLDPDATHQQRPGTILKVDAAAGSIVDYITLSNEGSMKENHPQGMILDTQRNALYFTTMGIKSQLVRIDLSTFKRVKNADVPLNASHMKIDVARNRAYALMGSDIVSIDLGSMKVLKTARAMNYPYSIEIDPECGFAYVLGYEEDYEFSSTAMTKQVPQVLRKFSLSDLSNPLQTVAGFEASIPVEDGTLGKIAGIDTTEGAIYVIGKDIPETAMASKILKYRLDDLKRLGLGATALTDFDIGPGILDVSRGAIYSAGIKSLTEKHFVATYLGNTCFEKSSPAQCVNSVVSTSNASTTSRPRTINPCGDPNPMDGDNTSNSSALDTGKGPVTHPSASAPCDGDGKLHLLNGVNFTEGLPRGRLAGGITHKGFLYVGTAGAGVTNAIIKIDTAKNTEVSRIKLAKDDGVVGGVIDAETNSAYFTILNAKGYPPFRVVKVDLNTFSIMQTLEWNKHAVLPGVSRGMAVIDPVRRKGYFQHPSAGKILELDLATFTWSGYLDATSWATASIDDRAEYLYAVSGTGLFKMRLSDMQYVKSLTLGKNSLTSAIIDIPSGHAYLSGAAGIWRVRLSDMTVEKTARVDAAEAIVLAQENLYLFTKGNNGYGTRVNVVRASDLAWLNQVDIGQSMLTDTGFAVVHPTRNSVYVGNVRYSDAPPTVLLEMDVGNPSCTRNDFRQWCNENPDPEVFPWCFASMETTNVYGSCGITRNVAISNDGTLVFQAGYHEGFMEGKGGLFVRKPNGSVQWIESQARPPHTIHSVSISGDGKVIAYFVDRPYAVGVDTAVYVHELETGIIQKISLMRDWTTGSPRSERDDDKYGEMPSWVTLNQDGSKVLINLNASKLMFVDRARGKEAFLKALTLNTSLQGSDFTECTLFGNKINVCRNPKLDLFIRTTDKAEATYNPTVCNGDTRTSLDYTMRVCVSSTASDGSDTNGIKDLYIRNFDYRSAKDGGPGPWIFAGKGPDGIGICRQ